MKRDSRDVSTVRLRESSVQGYSSTSSAARMKGEQSNVSPVQINLTGRRSFQ